MTGWALKSLGYAIWAALLVPVTLLMLWLSAGEWSWRGFLAGFVMLGVISISFEFFVGRVERWLNRRRNVRNSTPTPES
jgi:hypothetical protein